MSADPRPPVPHPNLSEIEREVAVHLDTLRDLGPEYTDSMAKALVEQLNPLIDAKVQQALAGRGGSQSSAIRERRGMVAAILGISIPLLAIAGHTGGAVGVAFVATAMFIIVVVAMTHNF
jgi:hypothetical protein